MDSLNSKRSRCMAFGPEEKLLIANICAKYKAVLENKKTDHVSSHQKNLIWDKISAEVNASNSSGIFRSKDVLKRFYENRKREVRKIAAVDNREIRKTGGGRALVSKKDECNDIFLSLMNRKTVYVLECEVGGDVEPTEPETPEENILEYEEVNTVNNETWQKYVPSDLLMPISQPLRIQEGTKAEITLKEEIPCSSQNANNRKYDGNKTSFQVNETWQKYLPSDFLMPKSQPLRIQQGTQAAITLKEEIPCSSQNTNKRKYDGVPWDAPASRRRPTTMKALTRTDFAEYNLLLDERLEVVKLQEEKIAEEIISIKMKREAKTKMDALEIQIKMQQLASLQSAANLGRGTGDI